MKKLLNVPQAAEILNVSKRMVWRLIKEGELRSVRIGGRILVDPEDLREFIESNKQGADYDQDKQES